MAKLTEKQEKVVESLKNLDSESEFFWDDFRGGNSSILTLLGINISLFLFCQNIH